MHGVHKNVHTSYPKKKNTSLFMNSYLLSKRFFFKIKKKLKNDVLKKKFFFKSIFFFVYKKRKIRFKKVSLADAESY